MGLQNEAQPSPRHIINYRPGPTNQIKPSQQYETSSLRVPLKHFLSCNGASARKKATVSKKQRQREWHSRQNIAVRDFPGSEVRGVGYCLRGEEAHAKHRQGCVAHRHHLNHPGRPSHDRDGTRAAVQRARVAAVESTRFASSFGLKLEKLLYGFLRFV